MRRRAKQHSPIEILLIGDDPAAAGMIRDMPVQAWKHGFSVRQARTLVEGLVLLREGKFDCVLIDLDLPGSRGLEAARAVRNQSGRVPVVLLAPTDDEDAAFEALQTDMQDFLVKGDLSGALLARAIRYAMQRKRIAGELLESEERFRATFNQAAVGIAHVAVDGSWLRINRKYCDMVGYTEEEMKTLTIEDITHPDDLKTSMEHFRRLLDGKIGNYSLEKRYIRKDGATVWANVNASMVTGPDGKPKFVVGIVEDITARKRTEEALLFSEARYRALYRDNPTMIFTLDDKWTILSANPTCAAQLGYTTEEFEGRSGLDVFHEHDRSAVAEQLRRCLKNPNTVYRWQFRKIRKGGGVVWVEETAQAVQDLSGAINILVVCQDITERRQAEEKLERLNSDLETANRELEAFNYTVAHDLRKPLTVINGYCQALIELCGDKLDEQCAGYLRVANDGTWRMNRLIDAMLDFSRLAHIEPRREMVDLSSMAEAAAAEIRLAEPKRRVTFRIAAGINANGDANLLRVVLDNLFGNAWKYTAMREEGIIEFGVSEIGGKRAYFVRDNGAGFDMADAEKLFAPFQCLPGAEELKGFGIGLSTVERIVRRHGGEVWAEGKPDGGAAFYFTLGPG